MKYRNKDITNLLITKKYNALKRIIFRTSDCLKTSPSLLKTHKTYFMILYSLIVSYMYEIHTRTK